MPKFNIEFFTVKLASGLVGQTVAHKRDLFDERHAADVAPERLLRGALPAVCGQRALRAEHASAVTALEGPPRHPLLPTLVRRQRGTICESLAAALTGEDPRGAQLAPVQAELSLPRKHHSAGRTSVRVLHLVYPAHVAGQMAAAREEHSADVALARLLARVLADVEGDGASVAERLSADVALVRLLASVKATVPSQGSARRKRLLAEVAGERPLAGVGQQVNVQLVLPTEGYAALVTAEESLPAECPAARVTRTMWRRFSAHVACVRLSVRARLLAMAEEAGFRRKFRAAVATCECIVFTFTVLWFLFNDV